MPNALRICALAGALATSVPGTAAPNAAPVMQPTNRIARLETEAKSHFDRGEFEQGIARLKEVLHVDPRRTEALLGMANAYDRWGEHCQESIEAFRRFITACNACPTAEQGEARYAAVRQKCEVGVTVESEPSGAIVRIDEEEWSRITPHATVLVAGEHRLVGTRHGRQRQEATIRIEPGRQTPVVLKLLPVRKTPEREPAPAIELPVPVGSWVSLGFAAAGAATGTIFAGLSLNAASDRRRAQLEGPDPARIEAADDRQTVSTAISFVGFGAAGVGIVGALIIHSLGADSF